MSLYELNAVLRETAASLAPESDLAREVNDEKKRHENWQKGLPARNATFDARAQTDDLFTGSQRP